MKTMTALLTTTLFWAAAATAGDDLHGAPHMIGAFAGATDPSGEKADLTYGLEYEYRASRRLGFGLIGERTPDGHHGDGVDVAVAAAHLHVGALRLTAGLGREWVDGYGSEPLQRLGVAYDIEVGPVALAPTVSVDFVDGHEIPVYGLVVLRHF